MVKDTNINESILGNKAKVHQLPIISVVIPTLNESNNILNLIERLQEESMVKEILVVDSPLSHDHLQTLLASTDVKYYQSPKPGRSCQMNFGATKATGSILYFLHADTLPPIGFGKEILQSHKQGNLSGYFSYSFDKRNFWLDLNSRGTRINTIFSGGGDQSLFIDRTLFEKVGGFNEKYCIMEDFDLVRTLKKTKNEPVLIKKDMIVSARKYDRNSYLKVNIVNFLMMIQFYAGTKPEKLKRFYKKWLN